MNDLHHLALDLLDLLRWKWVWRFFKTHVLCIDGILWVTPLLLINSITLTEHSNFYRLLMWMSHSVKYVQFEFIHVTLTVCFKADFLLSTIRSYLKGKRCNSFPEVPVWLKTLRLHKYSYLFRQMTYEEMLSISEEWLEAQVSKSPNKVTLGFRFKWSGAISHNRHAVIMAVNLATVSRP